MGSSHEAIKIIADVPTSPLRVDPCNLLAIHPDEVGPVLNKAMRISEQVVERVVDGQHHRLVVFVEIGPGLKDALDFSALKSEQGGELPVWKEGPLGCRAQAVSYYVEFFRIQILERHLPKQCSPSRMQRRAIQLRWTDHCRHDS